MDRQTIGADRLCDRRAAAALSGRAAVHLPAACQSGRRLSLGRVRPREPARLQQVRHLRLVTDARGYYALLGVAPTATADDIRRAFYAKAKALHPDTGEREDSAAFHAVCDAYQVLGDARRRARYDGWEGDTLEWIARDDPPDPLPPVHSRWGIAT